MRVDFYFLAAVATAVMLGILSLFRGIEARIPTVFHADFAAPPRDAAMSEEEMRALAVEHRFTVASRLFPVSRRLICWLVAPTNRDKASNDSPRASRRA